MAFASDFNEEDLQRALAAQGAAPVASGPGAPAAGGDSIAATPGGAAPTAAPGTEQGTGFVNLSRYFDANHDAADKSAAALIDPLKLDTKAIGDKAAAGVPMPTAPTPTPYEMGTPYTYDDSGSISGGTQAPPPMNGDNPGVFVPQPVNPDATDAANAANQADYQKALDAANAQADAARSSAVQNAGAQSLQTGRELSGDPLKRNEAMSKDGKNPAALDSYLAGAALPEAYQGLRDYYGVQGSRADPPVYPDWQPRPPAPPGSPPGPSETRNYTPPVPVSAASAMDPQLRKKSQNYGGW
jgi:hypothetical protein